MRAWWPDSFARVLDDAAALLGCTGPRQLEQATAELIGAELADRIQRHAGGHEPFSWMDGLIAAAAGRWAEGGTWYLLHGLAAICAERHRGVIIEVLAAQSGPVDAPDWLRVTPSLAVPATARLLVDGYGCRYGLLLDVIRPGERPRTYLIDVDPCSAAVSVPLAGMYPDQDAAVTAWRVQVGPSAAVSRPRPAPPELLAQLLPGDGGPFGVPMIGHETPRQLAEFYRIRRLTEALTEAMAKVGTSLPERRPRPTQVKQAKRSSALATAYLHWCAEQDLPRPDREPVEWLAEDWCQHHPDPTALGASPHRISAFLSYFLGFYADSPERAAAVDVLPTWIRYCLDFADVPPDLAAPALALAGQITLDPHQVAALAGNAPAPPVQELDPTQRPSPQPSTWID
jgi:hypothetical protein